MFPFFKKKKHTDNETQPKVNDSTVEADSLLGEQAPSSSDEEVETTLSLHPSWKLPTEQQYVYAFHNSECAPLKPNQISLSSIDLVETEESVTVTALIRQTLEKSISLKDTAILLIGPNNEKLGRKVFSLEEAGQLPSKSSRPWTFTFAKEDLFTDEIPKEGYKLAFELHPSQRQNSLDLADSWKKSLADEDKQKLEKIVQTAKPLKAGEINFMNLEAKPNQNGDLAVTLLLRNGGHQSVYFNQLPIQVEDATGDVVARGSFTLEKFEVKANTSKPWTFIFPKSLMLKENPDLSSWKAYPLQGKQEVN